MPFLPLQDAEIKRLDKGPRWGPVLDPKMAVVLLAKAVNRMGTARRCHLARLICTFRYNQTLWSVLSDSDFQPEGIQILTRVSEPVLFH